MKHTITSFADLELHDFWVIVRIHEGINVNKEYAPEFANILNKHFDTSFGWISDRTYSYSVDPLVIPELISKVAHFRCFSVVSHGQPQKVDAQLAQMFFPKDFPTSSFPTLEESLAWTQKTLGLPGES